MNGEDKVYLEGTINTVKATIAGEINLLKQSIDNLDVYMKTRMKWRGAVLINLIGLATFVIVVIFTAGEMVNTLKSLNDKVEKHEKKIEAGEAKIDEIKDMLIKYLGATQKVRYVDGECIATPLGGYE